MLVSFFYPNGHELRPALELENVFQKAVWLLYQADTPTNILPSVHVFNTVVCLIALLKNQRIQKCRAFAAGIIAVSGMIIASTVFLKQHSIIDVMLAILLNIVCYHLFYKTVPRYWEQMKEKGGIWRCGQRRDVLIK